MFQCSFALIENWFLSGLTSPLSVPSAALCEILHVDNKYIHKKGQRKSNNWLSIQSYLMSSTPKMLFFFLWGMQNNRAAWILLVAVTLKSHNRDADMLTVGRVDLKPTAPKEMFNLYVFVRERRKDERAEREERGSGWFFFFFHLVILFKLSLKSWN